MYTQPLFTNFRHAVLLITSDKTIFSIEDLASLVFSRGGFMSHSFKSKGQFRGLGVH